MSAAYLSPNWCATCMSHVGHLTSGFMKGSGDLTKLHANQRQDMAAESELDTLKS